MTLLRALLAPGFEFSTASLAKPASSLRPSRSLLPQASEDLLFTVGQQSVTGLALGLWGSPHSPFSMHCKHFQKRQKANANEQACH